MPTPRDFVKHDLTQCPHGQLARQCLLCEQAAEIERLTQRNNELRTANGFAELEAEIERLRADTKTLREAVVSAAHTLEQARVWDKMKWHWNINANATRRAWEILGSRTLTDGSPVTPDHTDIDPLTGQQKGYVVLSAEERAKGFVRPVRQSYVHEKCGAVTTMGLALAETYARQPSFYTGTFCARCRAHFPVGADGEFVWDGTSDKVGT